MSKNFYKTSNIFKSLKIKKTILISTSTFDFKNFEDSVLYLKSGFDVDLNPFKRRLSEAEILDLVSTNVYGLIAGVEPITKLVLESAKDLKVISRCGAGLDNIDLSAARSLNIKVLNTPIAPVQAVAELTMAHMLNLARGINRVDQQIKDGIWKPEMGFLVAGKKIGIIGFGKIGRKVAQIAIAFGSEILAYDQSDIESIPGVQQVDLKTLLKVSDVITLHLPYSPNVHHLIGAKEFKLMKQNAIVLNLSRGGLVDEEALADALNNKIISGAGIDTFESEPYRGGLQNCSNIILTAHMGSYAKESRDMQEKEAAQNLTAEFKNIGLI